MRVLTVFVTVCTLVVALSLVVLPTRITQAQGGDAAWIYAQLNILRQKHGLPPLTLNAQLTASATVHSNYLASHIYSQPHVEDNGSTPQSRISAAGYVGYGGENVVGGQTATVEWAFNWWLNSPAHYENMLADWTDVGIAVVDGGQYGKWYTTDFGNNGRAPRTAIPVANLAQQGAGGGAVQVAAAAVEQPRPTRRPPTRGPTETPSITMTPSITFTAFASFTPTDTATGRPPTATPIVLGITPQPGIAAQAVAQLSTVVSSTAEPSPTQVSMNIDSGAVAVAMVPSPPTTIDAPPVSKGTSGDAIRNLIPWAIGLQFVVVGGLIVGSIRRRKR